LSLAQTVRLVLAEQRERSNGPAVAAPSADLPDPLEAVRKLADELTAKHRAAFEAAQAERDRLASALQAMQAERDAALANAAAVLEQMRPTLDAHAEAQRRLSETEMQLVLAVAGQRSAEQRAIDAEARDTRSRSELEQLRKVQLPLLAAPAGQAASVTTVIEAPAPPVAWEVLGGDPDPNGAFTRFTITPRY